MMTGIDPVQALRITTRESHCNFRKRRREIILNDNRASFSEFELQFVSREEIKTLALKLKSSKDYSTLHQIQSAVSLGDENIKALFQVDGILSVLVGLLCCNDASKQLEAATCLTNLATGPHKYTFQIAKAAGAYLVSFIKGDSPFLQDQCAWATGNIAANCQACFEILKAQGLIPCLTSLLQSPYPEVIQSVIFSLRVCTRYDSISKENWITENLLHSLIQLSSHLRHDVKVDVLCILANIIPKIDTVSEDHYYKLVTCILSGLGKATDSEPFDVQLATPCVRVLLGLSTKSEQVCNFIFYNEAFSVYVMKVMVSQYHHLRAELLLVLTNLLISSGSRDPTIIDLECVVVNIKPFLTPLSSYTLEALYFLSVLSTAQKVPENWFACTGVLQLVDLLCLCGIGEIETAVKSFKSILNAS